MTGVSRTAADTREEVRTALTALYSWEYESEIDELRSLYLKGLDLQWMSVRELDWDAGIDRDAFCRTFTMGGIPVQHTEFWQGLSPEVRWEISRRSAGFMLSNFLHGEQGALFVAAQLVNAVPHMDGKFYAATQTVDEARHVEVFSTYIRMLDEIHPIAPALKNLLDRTMQTENWMLKCVGMQIVVEGLALFTFRDMRNATAEPLLKKLLTYVSRDEARHTAYGIKYLSAVVPTLAPREVEELEDFAYDAVCLLLDSRSGLTMRDSVLSLWQEVGIDPADVVTALREERDTIRKALAATGGRRGPVTGFVLPTMRSIGLYSERVQARFQEMFDNQGGQARRPSSRGSDLGDWVAELPEDLEAWVESEAG